MARLDARLPDVWDAASAVAGVACAHCTLPVPAGLVAPGSTEQFCCAGCRTAYRVIRAGGLEGFYSLVRSEPGEARRARERTDTRFAHFDDPAFHKLYVTPAPGGLRASLRVEGMHCAACVWLLERLARVCPSGGVIESRVDLRRRLLTVTWKPEAVRLSQIAAAAASLGYAVHPPRGLSSAEARRRESRGHVVRIGVAGAIMGNVMLLTLALFASDAESAAAAMDPAMLSFFRRLAMGFSLVSLAWPGSVFFKGAWAALRTRTASMDVPIAIGLTLGAGWGCVNAVRGVGSVYFDTITTLVFLLLLGRWIQLTQQHRAADAVELLFSLTPSMARLVEGWGTASESVRETPVEALSSGDAGAVVEVLTGGTVPVDGVIVEGTTEFDLSLLTGESRPVCARVGDHVTAGAVNLTGLIRVRAEAAGESTRVGQLMRLVEDAAREKAPMVILADRLSVVFVPVVLLLALGTGVAWAFIRPEEAIDHAAALLITTCPCALGLATPLAVIVSIGRAARSGILIKGGEALEAMARSRRGVVLLDKTGTITEGAAAMVEYVGDRRALVAAAAIERTTTHPAARAIVAAVSGPIPEARDVTHTLGRGLEGEVDGERVAVGSVGFVKAIAATADEACVIAADRMAGDGLTPVMIACDGRIVGVCGLGDRVRPDAVDAVAALKRAGWEVRILSGDDPRLVRAVGRQVGIDERLCRGGACPEDKLAAVRAIQRERPGAVVVMVGDGVNDAAALSAATVGVSVHGSAEASLAAGGVFLSRPGLAPLVELARGSARTVGVIKRNMAASLAYNAVFVTLAMTGVLTPLIAAVVMPLSSLTVVLLSTRSRTFDRVKGGPC
ncbi:MAG: heavy metal translocating P-type ATPase [Phycisphaerales bacterium]